MKTKGYSSANPVPRPKDEIHVYPRLTQSYLEQYHNNQSGCSPNQAAAIHDWQFNKYQQEVENGENNSIRKDKDGHHEVRFRADYVQPALDSAQNIKKGDNSLLGAYLSEYNTMFKESGWKGPSTPYPNKQGTDNGKYREPRLLI